MTMRFAEVARLRASEAKRRRRRGENVAPAEAPQVERREAPHPYVTGVRAPDRNGARRTLARFARGASQAPRRLPALHFPCVQGRRKMGKGDARRPKIEVPGRRSVGCL